jgi:RNA-binding protein
MTLSTDQKKSLRTIGHKLNPIITVAGKGITDTINDEIERALNDHELIKIKLICDDRDDKPVLTQSICNEHGAELVQATGHVILIYRKATKQNKHLSNLVRVL